MRAAVEGDDTPIDDRTDCRCAEGDLRSIQNWQHLYSLQADWIRAIVREGYRVAVVLTTGPRCRDISTGRRYLETLHDHRHRFDIQIADLALDGQCICVSASDV